MGEAKKTTHEEARAWCRMVATIYADAADLGYSPSVAIWCRAYAQETDYGRTHRQALQEAHAKVGEYRHQQRREEEQRGLPRDRG